MSVDVAAEAAASGRGDCICPLSEGQMAIWFGQMLDGGGVAYNIGEYLEIAGAVDRELLETALRHVVATTDTLRARIVETEDGPRQIIRPEVEWTLPFFDLCAERNPRAVADS